MIPRTITADVLQRAAQAYYETQVRPWADPADGSYRPWAELPHDDANAIYAEEVALILLQAAGLPIDRSIA